LQQGFELGKAAAQFEDDRGGFAFDDEIGCVEVRGGGSRWLQGRANRG
jgi:hypothetical protein